MIIIIIQGARLTEKNSLKNSKQKIRKSDYKNHPNILLKAKPRLSVSPFTALRAGGKSKPLVLNVGVHPTEAI